MQIVGPWSYHTNHYLKDETFVDIHYTINELEMERKQEFTQRIHNKTLTQPSGRK